MPRALDPRWLEGARSVGITAGASAPDELVEELIARLREMAGAEVEFLPGVTENVRFRMPPQLADTPSALSPPVHAPRWTGYSQRICRGHSAAPEDPRRRLCRSGAT